MGFLDHSTNNIIIDAVLTDTGRRLLADNQGKFRIAFFSLADDEVDYTIIQKFGRAVGKEKIIKNTPVFEAQTAGNIALKNRLLTLPDPTIVRLPTLSLVGTNLSANNLAFIVGQTETNSVTAEQQITGESRVPDGLSDTSYTVQIPDRFLTVSGRRPQSVEPNTRIASYTLVGNSGGEKNASSISVSLTLQPGLDDTIFNIFGNASNKNIITSVVSIIGDQSGLRKDFTFTVTRPNSTAFDFTGYSGAAQMQKSVAIGATNDIAATFTVGFTSATGGKIRLTLADTATRDIVEGRYVYDVNIVSAGSTYYKLVKGDIMVHAGVSTRP